MPQKPTSKLFPIFCIKANDTTVLNAKEENMLNRLVILGLIVSAFIFDVSAQSGRRVRGSSPTTAATPQPQTDTATAAQDTSAGVYTWDKYSESAPNSARTLSASAPRAEKKSKKERKEEEAKAKAQAEVAKTAPTAASGAAGEDDEVLKVETNLVSIPVSVYNRNGGYISELGKQNFKIFEDGKEQEVAYFATSEKPFTVVLLIDVSPSTAYKIEEIQNAAIAFVDQLKAQDSVMVVQFDSSVSVLTELTSDRNKIYKAIRKTGFGGGTSLYDAVDFSIRKRLKNVEGRKAIVLFTDGVDTTSNGASYESNVRDAEESDSIIFPIYYNTFLNTVGIGGGGGVMSSTPTLGSPFPGGRGIGDTSAEYARGRAYLEELSSATGGRVYRPETTSGGLNEAFEGIAEELRSQYSIGYYPPEGGNSGDRRQIRVRVNRPNVVVRARDSYIVGGK